VLVVAFSTICLSTFFTLDIWKTCPGNFKKVVTRSTYYGSWEFAQLPEIRLFMISNARVRYFSITNHLLSVYTGLKKFSPLLKGWPDRSTLCYWSKFSPLELIQKVIVLIEKLLLFFHVADNSKLNLTNNSFIDLSIDENVSSTSPQSILDPDNMERIVNIIAFFIEPSK